LLPPWLHFNTQSLAAALAPLSRWRSPTRHLNPSAQAVELKQLVERGENPYTFFRQREEDVRRAEVAEATEAGVKQRHLQLAQKIVKEDQLYDKDMASQRVRPV
jgi:hypothetical protein